jgi:hypothetical protein
VTINNSIIIFLLTATVILSGCQPAVVSSGPDFICPGQPSIEEAIRVLSLQQQNVLPLRASAECTFHYQDENGKEKKQTVNPVTVRFIPPSQIIFRGSEFGERMKMSFGCELNRTGTVTGGECATRRLNATRPC